jgi:hypothetical protein
MATKHGATIFLKHIISPALQSISSNKLPTWSPAAEELLLGTAIVESDLRFRKQHGDGPARGLFQMEPATHNDIWDNFLKYRPELAEKIGKLIVPTGTDKLIALEMNDKYACAMARVHYLRAPTPLPRSGDVEAMAKYWKDHYNTWKGRGKPSKYVDEWVKTMKGKQ